MVWLQNNLHVNKAKQLLKQEIKWDEIEKLILKLRKTDFKEFLKLSFQAFQKQPKVFHTNIQRAMTLKKKSKMNIDFFEDTNGNLLHDSMVISKEIERFYINKFSDQGRK